ncbi:MAG: porin [Armatimonadota bacterium]
MLTALTRFIAVLSLLVIAATAWAALPMKWTLGGYVQARYTEDLGETLVPVVTDTPGTFRAMRPSVLIRATDEEHVFLQFFFSNVPGGSDLEVQHAFAEYQAAPLYGRLGLSPIPFGYENPITSAALITTERSMASAVLIGRQALDRGVYFFYQPSGVFIAKPTPGQPGTFNAELGLVNGENYNDPSDSNNAKNFVGRLGVYIPNGEIGASIIRGKGTGADPVDKDRLGVDVQWRTGPFTLLAEYLTGEGAILAFDDEREAQGGYLTVAYRPLDAEGKPVSYQVYLRGDVFDRNVDAADDYFSRGTVGVAYYLNPLSKLQAEYESIDDSLNTELDGRFTLQYQIIFL